MQKKGGLFRGLAAVFAILLIFTSLMSRLLVSWSGQVNIALNVTIPTTEADGENIVYNSAYGLTEDGLTAMLADSDAHDIQTMAEGAVLLKNEENALPLQSDEKNITLFGRATADPVYRGNSGGPSVDANRQISLYDALSNSGFSINDTLYDAYAQSDVARVKADPDWFIGEVDSSFYTKKLHDSYADSYNDVAIVMFSRDGGEGKDLAFSDRDGISYLALHDTEKDLLKMIQDSGKFKKTIVLINSGYAMELGWLDQEEYGIDAALWIGTPGLLGFTGVAEILCGNVDPSGRTADTYAANSLSSPAVANAGDFTFSNSTEKYIVEAEDIYVGYKYYESRYHDQVLGINNADSTAGVFAGEDAGWNYADEMTYTFGYGLSYTNFSQELVSLEWDQTTHMVNAVVRVTNNGIEGQSDYNGSSRSVVELYASLPYESGQAQKSAIQLIGFGKTGNLAVNESEDVTISVEDYLFATYDENAVNGADSDKLGCYVFDPGDYYFAIGTDCHDALNNIMAAKYGTEVEGKLFDAKGELVTGNTANTACIPLDAYDNTTYAVSAETGEIVSNQFDDIDYNYFVENGVTYLTRDDWNTFPISYTDLKVTDEMLSIINEEDYQTPSDAPAYDSFTLEAQNNLSLSDMVGIDYEDETWDKFIDQLSLQDLTTIIGENFGQKAITSVTKPINKNNDGPAGTQGNYPFGDNAPATVHVGQAVAAATWDQELLTARGNFIGEDCLFVGTQQLWCPGADLHRTPFSGRNFEYYSEDSIFTYLMGAAETKGMQEKGLNASIKHFCGNDQETNRSGLSQFMTEQAYRQGPLKGFEGAFTKGGALATMMSFSRIGCHIIYQDAATLRQVLRDEWGFAGVNITDSVKGITNVNTLLALAAGTDTFNADEGRASEVLKYVVANKDGYLLQCLREANKHFYYAMANSSLVNGLSSETVVSDFIPWWQYALYGLQIILAFLTLLFVILSFRSVSITKLKDEKGKLLERILTILMIAASILFIIIDRNDRTFSWITCILVLIGCIPALIQLKFRLYVLPFISAVCFGGALSYHLYLGLPTLSDIINGVNFIGGNPNAVIIFGIIFLIGTIGSVIRCFIFPKNELTIEIS